MWTSYWETFLMPLVMVTTLRMSFDLTQPSPGLESGLASKEEEEEWEKRRQEWTEKAVKNYAYA